MNDPTDPQRRHVLAMMSALGAGALCGFATDEGIGAADSGTPAVLPRGSIDVHTHFFNASDASVIGYLTHSVAHANPKLQKFLKRMEGVLKALIHLAPSARSERERLEGILGKDLSPEAVGEFLDGLEREQRDLIAPEVTKELRNSGVMKEFGGGFDAGTGFEPLPENVDEVRALLDPDTEDSNKDKAHHGTTIAGVFRFLARMLQYRSTNLRIYQRWHGARGISAAFGALVDFDYFYDDPASSPLAEQVLLHALISRLSNGFMLPLVAYNPWADIKTGGARLELVRKAVKAGFIGAKIYPPVGFRPAGNAPQFPDLDADVLNDTLARFFHECYLLGIPVMAHANSSAGRDKEADQNSRPEGWQLLMNRMAENNEVPLLNLGHFGGDGDELIDGKPNDWPPRFAQLMGESGGERIYGDLGYWSRLRECQASGNKADCRAAQARLADARKAFPKLDERLMYGSDYFMMIKEVRWKQWPEDIAGAMKGHFDLDRLFRRNAMQCFGLLPGGDNRKRLEDIHRNRLPAWMG